MSDIYKLYDDIALSTNLPAEYVEKQLHRVPSVPVIDRLKYLTEQATGKVVLDIGASGPAIKELKKAAKEYHGLDRQQADVYQKSVANFYEVDIEAVDSLPEIDGLELVIAGEVLEHLSNAGRCLDLLRAYSEPVIITVPNAHSLNSLNYLKKGIENVNKEHVAWYSYHTLKVLIERHGYKLIEWFWYNGKPIFAEGLIFKVENG